MTPDNIPMPVQDLYPDKIWGYIGTFGHGAGVRVTYLQGALPVRQLDQVKLVGDLEESEKWPVSALFQRQVNKKRVEEDIAPYLLDESKVKFFNPLTLVLLPKDSSGGHPDPQLVHMPVESTLIEGGGGFSMRIANGKHFELSWRAHNEGGPTGYGSVQWNNLFCDVVAIDGQHRLAALKAVKRSPADRDKISDWTVPVVVLAPGAEQPTSKRSLGTNASLLRVMRSLFLFINKEAQAPTRTRQILLSDSSVNCLALQELVQLSHTQHLQGAVPTSRAFLPLTCFDWQEAKEHGILKAGHLFSAEEVHDWIEHYVLGLDFQSRQERRLRIDPTDNAGINVIWDKALEGVGTATEGIPLGRINEFRSFLRARVARGLALFLGAFGPYARWGRYMRDKESAESQDSTFKARAWHLLRYGADTTSSTTGNRDAEQKAYQALVSELGTDVRAYLCGKMPLYRDIGQRAVAYAYGSLIDCCPAAVQVTPEEEGWDAYSIWAAELLTSMADDWLDKEDKKLGDVIYRHIVSNERGVIIKYRLTDVPQYFGALLAYVAGRLAHDGNSSVNYSNSEEDRQRRDVLATQLEEHKASLMSGLLRAYRAEARRHLEWEHADWTKEKLKTEAAKKGKAMCSSHWNAIEKRISGLHAQSS